VPESKAINYEKWKQYRQLTVDEAMNLISGFEPGSYKFCSAKEKDMPPESVPIYRALVHDFNSFKIKFYMAGERVDISNLGKFIHPDEFYNNSCWWIQAILTVNDIKEWLIVHNFKSEFFEINSQKNEILKSSNIPDYLNKDHPYYSFKLAATIKMWEIIANNKNLIKGKGIRKAIEDWLDNNAVESGILDGEQLSAGLKDAISYIVNWNIKGGAPKTPVK